MRYGKCIMVLFFIPVALACACAIFGCKQMAPPRAAEGIKPNDSSAALQAPPSAILSLLPPDGLVAGSVRYFIERHEEIGPVVEALEACYAFDTAAGEFDHRVILARFARAEDASAAFSDVRNRISRDGKVAFIQRMSVRDEISFGVFESPADRLAFPSEIPAQLPREVVPFGDATLRSLWAQHDCWVVEVRPRRPDYPKAALLLDWILERLRRCKGAQR